MFCRVGIHAMLCAILKVTLLIASRLSLDSSEHEKREAAAGKLTLATNWEFSLPWPPPELFVPLSANVFGTLLLQNCTLMCHNTASSISLFPLLATLDCEWIESMCQTSEGLFTLSEKSDSSSCAHTDPHSIKTLPSYHLFYLQCIQFVMYVTMSIDSLHFAWHTILPRAIPNANENVKTTACAVGIISGVKNWFADWNKCVPQMEWFRRDWSEGHLVEPADPFTMFSIFAANPILEYHQSLCKI